MYPTTKHLILRGTLIAVLSLSFAALANSQEFASSLAKYPKQIQDGSLNKQEFFAKLYQQSLQLNAENISESANVLAVQLEDESPEVRHIAAVVINQLSSREELEPKMTFLQSHLANHLLDSDEATALTCALALGNWKQGVGDNAVAALMTASASDSAKPRLRMQYVAIANHLRPGRADVVNAFTQFLSSSSISDDDKGQAITMIASPTASDEIIDKIGILMSSESSPIIRNAAVSASVQLGPRGVARLQSQLTNVLRDPAVSDKARATARRALNATVQGR